MYVFQLLLGKLGVLLAKTNTCMDLLSLLLFQGKMNAFLLLGCFVLTTTEYFLISAHMIPEERLSTNRVVVSNVLSQSLEIGAPPVVIVGEFTRLD